MCPCQGLREWQVAFGIKDMDAFVKAFGGYANW